MMVAMGWRQIWTEGAKRVRDRLPLPENAAICKAIEAFLHGSTKNVHRHTPSGGTLTVGRFRVDFLMQRDATYTDDDGEENVDDVCWIVDLYTP
jgi:hypothetical protein